MARRDGNLWIVTDSITGKTYAAETVWTISRGRDTYGYNVCTLLVDGRKVARCNGGGYDMTGTVLGTWIEQAFADRLNGLTESFYGLTFHDPNYNPSTAVLPSGKTVAEAEKDGESFGLDRYQAFYAASSKTPTERHTIPSMNGACGKDSMVRIAEQIGLRFEYKR